MFTLISYLSLFTLTDIFMSFISDYIYGDIFLKCFSTTIDIYII